MQIFLLGLGSNNLKGLTSDAIRIQLKGFENTDMCYSHFYTCRNWKTTFKKDFRFSVAVTKSEPLTVLSILWDFPESRDQPLKARKD